MAVICLCQVKDCDKRSKKRGFCIAHYKRFMKYGDPTGGGVPRGSLMQWIEKNASYDGDECLLWPFGKKGDDGRGSVQFRGRSYSASRVMCIVAHGEPPEGKNDAAHSCGNGHLACCTPRHLRWASRLENVSDSIGHGTTARGHKQHCCKLSPEDVIAIRASSERQVDAAKRYGVTRQTIGDIRSRRRWLWVD